MKMTYRYNINQVLWKGVTYVDDTLFRKSRGFGVKCNKQSEKSAHIIHRLFGTLKHKKITASIPYL